MATSKFKALTHFVINECADDPSRLGALRLNKALWHTDVLAYRATGQSVTGDSYVKRKNGPVPAEVLATIRELQNDGLIHVREPRYQFDPRRYMSLEDPDTSALSEQDIQLARNVIDYVYGKTTTEISDETHDVVWEAAKDGEPIPLEATLVGRNGAITSDVANWAIEQIREKAA